MATLLGFQGSDGVQALLVKYDSSLQHTSMATIYVFDVEQPSVAHIPSSSTARCPF